MRYFVLFLIPSFVCVFVLSTCAQDNRAAVRAVPRIVNIVNFIRLLEPRDSTITEDVLYQTVVKQVEIMRKCRVGGTFSKPGNGAVWRIRPREDGDLLLNMGATRL